jgi:primosomal protein DnaI
MEAIGEVLKQLPFSKLGEKHMEQLLKDPLVRQLLLDYPQITPETVKLYLNDIYQYVKESKQCGACPGLAHCPNDYAGHYTLLNCEVMDDDAVQIYDRQVPCALERQRAHEEQIRSRVRSFYIDDRIVNSAFSRKEILTADKERWESLAELFKYIEVTKAQGLQRKGLFLLGAYGVGKTFLMCYMLHELAQEGYTGAILYMPEFIEDMKLNMHEPQKQRETLELLKQTDILVFDDIGAEMMSAWARDHILASVLNYRMDRKPTFYTSNYTLNELEDHFSFTARDGEDRGRGQRLMERIRPFVDIVKVEGKNKR